MTTEEVKEIPCKCGHPKTVHETFKGRLVCGAESCTCGNFAENSPTIPASPNGGTGDWWADLVESALDGALTGLKGHVKKKLGK